MNPLMISRWRALDRGITLVEVVASISIMGFAVAATFLAFSTGLRIQEETRARLLASTMAMKFFDDFANLYPGGHNRATEARSLIENPGLTATGMAFERVISGWGSGCTEMPRDIAYRLDSDDDEIATVLRAGGSLHFLTSGLDRATAGSSNALAGFIEVGETRLPRETSKLIFAIVGNDQANSLYFHPILSWPYYSNYPAPPLAYNRDLWVRNAWPGQAEFEDLWNYCTGTWKATTPYWDPIAEPSKGELFDKRNRFHVNGIALSLFGTAAKMREQVEVLNDKAQALLAAVLPVSLLDAGPAGLEASIDAALPSYPAHQRRWPASLDAHPLPNPDGLANGWCSLTGDAAITAYPRPWQVLATGYAAWAALLRTSTLMDGAAPSFTGGAEASTAQHHLFFQELHRRCLQWACRGATAAPTDWGAPRPRNRMLAWDNPLLEWDLFPLNLRSPPAGALETSTANILTFHGATRKSKFPRTAAGNPAATGRDAVFFMGTAADLDRQFKVVGPVPPYTTTGQPPWQANPVTIADRAFWTPTHLGVPQGVISCFDSFDCNGISMKNLPAARTYVRDGDAGGPGTLMDSWGTMARSTLCAPFQPAERTRHLVFWYVDWQAYEDWESGSGSNRDASEASVNSRGHIVYSGDGSRINLSATNPTYWNPTDPACPGYRGPRDINMNGIAGESGPVPARVRMRARTIARYPIYDPRLLTTLRF
jgi:hypothetical protein